MGLNDDPDMTHCYRCGRVISESKRQLRRKVQTGEWVRRTYSRSRIEAVQKHYGRRVVCAQCARTMDRQAVLKELSAHAWVLALLGGGLLYLLLSQGP